ncbi:MAG: DNA-binding protein WhiA [Firmicutes bacterium]|nr:DNA-binding protein WhiA [Bacillota bacterium]
MSFATETKNELSRVVNEKKCCTLAEIAGFVRVAGSLGMTFQPGGGSKFTLSIATDNPAVARHYKRMIEDYFKVETEIEVGEAQGPKKGHTYIISIGKEKGEQVLREVGILLVREGNNYISDGIYGDLIRSKCSKKAYLRGVFMGAGTMTDPNKGYHLEFVCASKMLSADLKKMINSFVDLNAKVVKRKDRHIVYMKSAEYICDTLSLMGADAQRLEFENVRLKKELLNETVRLTNCDSANTDRTLDASQHQIENIRKIEEMKGLESLPEKLRVVAELRLEYPEASLTQLAEMLDPPMKKSGINNRFRKIEEIANKL